MSSNPARSRDIVETAQSEGLVTQVILDSLPVEVAVLEPDGRIRAVNETWVKFGQENGALSLKRISVGANYLEVCRHASAQGAPEAEAAIRGITAVQEGARRHFAMEYPCHSPSQQRWFLMNVVPLSGGAGLVVTHTDISEWKRAQRLAQQTVLEAKDAAEHANRAKDRFLAMLSHELRTPLTPVLLTLEMMDADQSLSEDHRELLDMIRRNVNLEARLIDDLLDLTRIANGKVEMHLTAVDLHQTILDVIQICDNDIRSKQLKLTLELMAEPHLVQADTARIQQVLWNILKNATKFTPNGGQISILTNNPSADRVAVIVQDNGIGIDPNLLPKIFDAFEQGDKRRTRQFGGLGLGLAISKGLVQLHGGTLSAKSEGRGRGATFTLELGTTKPAQVADRCRVSESGYAKQERRPRILLVEDHVDTARAIASLLKCAGYDVKIATSVNDALRAAEAEQFDAMISDIGLPDGDGLDLLRQLQARRPIKAIAMSGFGMEEDVRMSKEAGFIAHLIKPVDVSRLEELLEEICA